MLAELELDILDASLGGPTTGLTSFEGEAARDSDAALATDVRPEIDGAAVAEGLRALVVLVMDARFRATLGGREVRVREGGR